VQRWKPWAIVYRYAAEVLGVDPADLAFVAAHPWDTHGAKRAGLRTAYVSRRAPIFPSPPASFGAPVSPSTPAAPVAPDGPGAGVTSGAGGYPNIFAPPDVVAPDLVTAVEALLADASAAA
jgi:hypothetical protein